ncbi:uncharacterized protein [Fopius arisanus]|uniref:Uncharacterized protein n=1 Tax=Fopius arisanus TaxID=64838 RepID=A0A9R1TIL9_9HYME|nr:PREDICTED: uncharacterized protein LOC105270672 [Fopius arisanus]
MSCYDSLDVQLYLLELTLESLHLTDEKVYECDKRPLLVKIKYLDLPIFVLSPRDFDHLSPSGNETKNGSTLFSSGRSCLFGKMPKSLVREMQTEDLKIGVFCVNETYPIAQAALRVSGCMCDQIAMAGNDNDHLALPFTMGGEYGLVDPGENHSGIINLRVKLTCLGKYVTTHYQMRDNAFVFKSDREVGEFLVKPIVPGDEVIKGEAPVEEGIEVKSQEKMKKMKKKK